MRQLSWGHNKFKRLPYLQFSSKAPSIHPGRLAAGTYSHHQFREEHDLPNLHEDMFHVNLQGCRRGRYTPWSSWNIHMPTVVTFAFVLLLPAEERLWSLCSHYVTRLDDLSSLSIHILPCIHWCLWFHVPMYDMVCYNVYIYMTTNVSGQFITTSAEVTPNGRLARESLPKNGLTSG